MYYCKFCHTSDPDRHAFGCPRFQAKTIPPKMVTVKISTALVRAVQAMLDKGIKIQACKLVREYHRSEEGFTLLDAKRVVDEIQAGNNILMKGSFSEYHEVRYPATSRD